MQPVSAPVAGLLLAVGLVHSASAQAPEADVPMEVTTDTPEYCSKLAARVQVMEQEATPKPSREVCDLSTAGRRMCATGQTRGGILRLRRAIMLMMQSQTPPVR